MPSEIGPEVRSALRQGLGPRAGLRAARENGLKTNDARWYRQFARERNTVALQNQQRDDPLNRVPPRTGVWSTKSKRGRATLVNVVHRDKVTGAVGVSIVTVKSKRPISRGNAIRQASAQWADPDRKYPTTVVAAYVNSTYDMIPRGVKR